MAWTIVQDLEEVKPTVKEAQIWAEWIKIRVFYHFLKCDSLVFLEIAQDDRLEQCLTTSRGKTHEKNLWAYIWDKQAKIGSELDFLPFSQFWFISFPVNCIE